MPTYRLTVEYEGTRYRGWQEQKNARTVAGELRRALESVLGETVELGGAGRTDAGVHALAQVAHLRCRRALEPAALATGLERELPADIGVVALEPAAPRFHARHHARLRSYVYQIARRRTALGKRFVWWVRRPLDAAAMAAAWPAVVGRHDFVRFAERPAEPESGTLVVVERAELAESGDLIVVRIAASHFLWKMVRRLVGALVELGAGALDRAQFEALVAAEPGGERLAPAEWTAPPSGLFLERVLYEGDPPLGALAPPVPVRSPPVGAAPPPLTAARAGASPRAATPRARPGRASSRGPRPRAAGPGRRGPRARR